jgi:hypothetical protein
MFEYPSMPPSRISHTSAQSQHFASLQQGSHLLLFSIASATAAVTITAGRLLLSETGTVLLLLSDGTSYGLPSFEGDFIGECKTQTLPMAIGKFMVAAASSPYVRSTPLICIFLSSAAFVVGVILIRNDLTAYAIKLNSIIGMEMVHKIRRNVSCGRNNLLQKLERGVDYVDSMVADDVIRAFVKSVNEIVTCAAGGYALYSLPDQVLSTSSHHSTNETSDGRILGVQNNNARRQVICAMDPSLDDVLFHPGGLWNITPGFREYLTGLTRGSIANKPVVTFDADAPTVDSTANESDSHEIDDENEKLRSDGSLPKLIHVRQPQQSGAASSQERGPARSEMRDAKNSSSATHTNTSSARNHQQQEPSPSTIQYDKILQRTACAATFCFFLHLHKSPSTRKTWKSTIHFFASCGLLSTAVSAGVASLLTSNADNSVIASVCTKAIRGMSLLPNAKLMESWNTIRDTIKRNRQLQMALAFSVFYGLKRRAALNGGAGRRR